MKSHVKIILISGPIIALGVMLGTAVGVSIDNIRIGAVFGLLVGVVLSCIIGIFLLKRK